MATFTLTADQARIARLAVAHWDRWTGTDTLAESDEDTLDEVRAIFAAAAAAS